MLETSESRMPFPEICFENTDKFHRFVESLQTHFMIVAFQFQAVNTVVKV
jgi:hypothetical protein